MYFQKYFKLRHVKCFYGVAEDKKMTSVDGNLDNLCNIHVPDGYFYIIVVYI